MDQHRVRTDNKIRERSKKSLIKITAFKFQFEYWMQNEPGLYLIIPMHFQNFKTRKRTAILFDTCFYSRNFIFWNSNTFKLCPKWFPVRRFDHSVAHRRTSKRLIARCVYKCEMREYFNWINMHLGHVTRIPIYFIGL